MKLIFSNYDDLQNPFFAGGGATAIHEITKRFAKTFDVTVITAKYPGSINKKVDGVFYKRIGVSFLGPKLGQIIYHSVLPFYVLSEKFDLWIESFTPPFSTSFLPLYTKKPVIGLAHMLSAEDMQRKYKLPFRLIEEMGLKFYKHLIVLSDNDKNKILSTNKNAQIALIPNGIYIPKKGKNVAKKHLLFIGRIEVNQKGLDLLIDAYSLLPALKRPKLIIAGSGTAGELEKLEKLIDKKGLVKEITLAGRVSGRKKTKLFQQSLSVIIPSRFETFSQVALEAMAHDVPLITFDIPGLSWIPKDCAVKVRPFNIKLLTKALNLVIKSGKLRDSLVKNSRSFVRKYSWEVAFKKYREYLSKVLNTNSSRFESSKTESFKKIIESVVREKTHCYFISPHLDDAAISAGALIGFLKKRRVPITIINVFTKTTHLNTLSARAYLRQVGFKNQLTLYKNREKEDEESFSEIGINPINLGYQDALWRQKSKLSKLEKFLSKPIPEFANVYPTYRWHIMRAKIDKHDEGLIDKLEKDLQSLIPENNNHLIFCPLATSGHTDHLIVRKACSRLSKNIVFWEDCSYEKQKLVKETKDVLKNLTKQIFSQNIRQKKSLVNMYKTQLAALRRDGMKKVVPDIYYYNKKRTNYLNPFAD